MGYNTKSKSFGGFVTGVFNDSTNAADPLNINSLNRIFQIGNGTADNARSNAMTVLQNGNTGINTTTPQSLLQVKNGAVLFDGITGTTPISGAGSRMMWIPARAAFRAGFVDATQWDDSNIGIYSFASGFNSLASNAYSTAIGRNTTASGYSSIAIGYGNTSSGDNSIAMGYNTTASAALSTTMGQFTAASAVASTAMGQFTSASGYASTAMGQYTSASGNFSTATGIFTKSKSYGGFTTGLYNDSTNAALPTDINSLNRIFQIGNGTADNARSNAMTVLQNGNIGVGISTPEAVLDINGSGWIRSGLVGPLPTAAGTGLRLFYNGNAGQDYGEMYSFNYSTFTPRNLILQNPGGNIGIGTSAPTAKLSVNGTANNASGVWTVFSDERIKTITDDFTDGLSVINKIQPVKFRYNDNAPFKTDEEQIGIVAQDLEKIAPYMVSKQAYNQFTDLREVNNQAYVFLLINAVKEQQVQIEAQQKEYTLLQVQITFQQKENKEQKERMDALEKLIKELSRKVN
jgi:hypothetical protein